MNPEQWLSLKWNGGSTMSDRWLNQSKIIHIDGIQYRVYYNSCNLEHVLYDELKDFTDDEKLEKSDDFAEQYEGKSDEFIQFISDESVAVEGSYKETWEYIEKDLNSLNRHSNMNLIFQKE